MPLVRQGRAENLCEYFGNLLGRGGEAAEVCIHDVVRQGQVEVADGAHHVLYTTTALLPTGWRSVSIGFKAADMAGSSPKSARTTRRTRMISSQTYLLSSNAPEQRPGRPPSWNRRPTGTG